MVGIHVKASLGDLVFEVNQVEGKFTQTVSLSHEEAVMLRDKLNCALKQLSRKHGRSSPKPKSYECKYLGDGGNNGGVLFQS